MTNTNDKRELSIQTTKPNYRRISETIPARKIAPNKIATLNVVAGRM